MKTLTGAEKTSLCGQEADELRKTLLRASLLSGRVDL